MRPALFIGYNAGLHGDITRLSQSSSESGQSGLLGIMLDYMEIYHDCH